MYLQSTYQECKNFYDFIFLEIFELKIKFVWIKKIIDKKPTIKLSSSVDVCLLILGFRFLQFWWLFPFDFRFKDFKNFFNFDKKLFSLHPSHIQGALAVSPGDSRTFFAVKVRRFRLCANDSRLDMSIVKCFSQPTKTMFKTKPKPRCCRAKLEDFPSLLSCRKKSILQKWQKRQIL